MVVGYSVGGPLPTDDVNLRCRMFLRHKEAEAN